MVRARYPRRLDAAIIVPDEPRAFLFLSEHPLGETRYKVGENGSVIVLENTTGGCLCGAVRLVASGEPYRVGICHCMDCRKHHGALFFVAAIFPEAAVAIEGDTRAYNGRHFCPNCGSSVFARWSDEIEVHLGALDFPDQFIPTYENWIIRRETWLPPLPVTKHYPKDREGSGRSE